MLGIVFLISAGAVALFVMLIWVIPESTINRMLTKPVQRLHSDFSQAVSYKFRCSYCKAGYQEWNVACPNCGAINSIKAVKKE